MIARMLPIQAGYFLDLISVARICLLGVRIKMVISEKRIVLIEKEMEKTRASINIDSSEELSDLKNGLNY